MSRRVPLPLLVAIATVGVTMGGLLVGYEPTGGDAARLFRPLKLELARSLREGRLPFWSDRFGLGVPLIGESQVAAFYPPNWFLYTALDVSVAYRLAMWLHYVALVGATYVYGRRLGLSPWGSALAGLAVTLCGFQAIHASTEPFYCALPLLLIALICTEHYVASGRLTSLVVLALAWGFQLTVGHFQIQMSTAGVVLVVGLWRAMATGAPWRALGVAAGLALGAGIAAIQIVPTWDYARFVGATHRPLHDLMYFSFPPAHWAELAIPRLFQGLEAGPDARYWHSQGTSGYEASLYLGTVPLVLAFVAVAAGRDRALAPWRVLVPASFALATMPHWWPDGYQALLQLPGFGYFRAPGRYTVITSLGIGLLAGRGFDRVIATRRFFVGLGLAAVFGTAAAAWAAYWARSPEYQLAMGDGDLRHALVLASIAWILSVSALLAWRAGKLPSVGVFVLAGSELALLYYSGPTVWSRSVRLPEDSPILRRLAQEPADGTVAGPVDNLPVHASHAATLPYFGMGVPLPMRALEFARYPQALTDPRSVRLLRHTGGRYGIYDAPVSAPGLQILYEGTDEALDRVIHRPPGSPARATWYLVRYAEPSPSAHVARHAREAPDVRTLLSQLARGDSGDTAWFLPEDRPRDLPGPRAQSAQILRWDGRRVDVDHDGTCHVVIRRTYAPGWTARINDGPTVPVVPVDGGLQSVRLVGSGPTRISLQYRPPRLAGSLAVSMTCLGAALLVLGRAAIASRRRR